MAQRLDPQVLTATTSVPPTSSPAVDVDALWEVAHYRVGIHPDGIGYVPAI